MRFFKRMFNPDISPIVIARLWRRVCHRATAGDWIPYLNSTSQGQIPEDARKNAHIRSRSRQLVKYPG